MMIFAFSRCDGWQSDYAALRRFESLNRLNHAFGGLAGIIDPGYYAAVKDTFAFSDFSLAFALRSLLTIRHSMFGVGCPIIPLLLTSHFSTFTNPPNPFRTTSALPA
jgi:hypothetical protein